MIINAAWTDLWNAGIWFGVFIDAAAAVGHGVQEAGVVVSGWTTDALWPLWFKQHISIPHGWMEDGNQSSSGQPACLTLASALAQLFFSLKPTKAKQFWHVRGERYWQKSINLGTAESVDFLGGAGGGWEEEGGRVLQWAAPFLLNTIISHHSCRKFKLDSLKPEKWVSVLLRRSIQRVITTLLRSVFFPPKSWLINLLELYFKELDGLVDNALKDILLENNNFKPRSFIFVSTYLFLIVKTMLISISRKILWREEL